MNRSIVSVSLSLDEKCTKAMLIYRHKMKIQTKGMEAGGAGAQKSRCACVDYWCM